MGLQYQTLQVENRMPFKGGPSARAEGVSGGVKLLHKAAVALNAWAVSWRVNQEISARAAEIQQKMPLGGGVLLCVATQEWDRPDFTGTRAQTFLSLHIVGAGTDPAHLLRTYLSQPQLVQGAAPGWRRRDAYVWVTRSVP